MSGWQIAGLIILLLAVMIVQGIFIVIRLCNKPKELEDWFHWFLPVALVKIAWHIGKCFHRAYLAEEGRLERRKDKLEAKLKAIQRDTERRASVQILREQIEGLEGEIRLKYFENSEATLAHASDLIGGKKK